MANLECEGYIGHFGLTAWWRSTFTESEREYIEQTFTPFSSMTLTRGTVDYTSDTAPGLLCSLASWFNTPKDRSIAQRILSEGERRALEAEDVISRHLILSAEAVSAYKARNIEDSAFSEAIAACEKQISISRESRAAFKRKYRGVQLPSHYGYKQLAIIREKQGRYDDALQLSEDAKQQGWSGDWGSRIDRLKTKLGREN